MEISINEERNLVLKKIFNPIVMETEDGQRISICMRDDGFEIASNGSNLYYALDGKIEPRYPEVSEVSLEESCCGLCHGPNDIGEICERCAEENPESTMKHALENGDSKNLQKASEAKGNSPT